MKKRQRIISAWVLIVFFATPACHAEQSTYLGLWGKLFNASTTVSAPSSTFTPSSEVSSSATERIHEALQDWRQGAQSRLAQRFNSKYDDETTASDNTNDTESTNALTEIAHLFGELGTLPDDEDDGSTFGDDLLDKIHERLDRIQLGRLDAHQLAALAVLQGYALSTLVKKYKGTGMEYKSLQATAQPQQSLSSQMQQLGVVVPTSLAQHFQPELCMRLQNFGNADGYKDVYFGKAPCMQTLDQGTSTAQIAWQDEVGFTVDCTVLHGSGSAVLQRTLSCRLFVTSDNYLHTTTNDETAGAGSGVIVSHVQSFSSPLQQPKLNTLRLRLCNMPPSTIQYPAGLQSSKATIEVHSLKLNNHKVADGHQVMTVQHGGSGDGCISVMVRVPSGALGDSFVLTGGVFLNTEVGNRSEIWGVGGMASVELQMGILHYLPQQQQERMPTR